MRIAHTRQAKSIPLIYGGLAGLLLIVIAGMALVLVPPSPPQVAEFAPQAQEQIEDSLEDQSSQFGSGAGACAAGQVCDFTDLMPRARAVVEKTRVRRCVGNPPLQIEDPQSPPCVNYWEGNNGGATSKGVTRDEIIVAYHSSVPPSQHRLYDLLFRFFNSRFEFYGRHLTAVEVTENDSNPNARYGPEYQRALAQKVAEQYRAFSAVGWTRGRSVYYFRELARQKVIGINHLHGYETSEDQSQFAPFLWSYRPPLDETLRNAAEFVCNSLGGKPASHAGPATRGKNRSFAVAVDGSGTDPDYDALEDGINRCGLPVSVVVLPEALDGGFPGMDRPDYSVIVADLQASGVTSILCVCGEGQWTQLGYSASRHGYEPEFIATGMADVSDWWRPPSRENRNRWFGLGSDQKDIPLQDQPFFWALKEMDPTVQVSLSRVVSLSGFYKGLLLLSSGIQMAGPNLTPQTFEHALMKSSFPNPGAGQAPYWQSSVGFRKGDHAMSDDFNLFWWSPQSRVELGDNDSQAGGYCYINRGERWSLGRWPKGELPFFDRSQPCR